MDTNELCFQSKRKLFVDYAAVFMANSPEYRLVSECLDELLLLADRILAATKETLEFGRVWDVADALNDVAKLKAEGSNLYKASETLLKSAELWVRTVLWLVDENIWLKDKTARYPVLVRHLGLLLQHEIDLDIDHYRDVNDPARELILLAYRYRNPITHNPDEWPESAKDRFLPAALVMILAPLYKHKESIRNRLESLISSPLPSNEVLGILRLIDSERRHHLEGFAGREKWLIELRSKLEGPLRDSGTYLLLTGMEGMGKSAICAKLSEEMLRGISPIGRYSDDVRRYAPWLPQVVLHFGKQSGRPDEIVRLLLTQINTLLLEPLTLPKLRDYSSPELVFKPEVVPQSVGDTSIDRSASDSVGQFGTPGNVYSSPFSLNSQYRIQTIQYRRELNNSDMMQYRRMLFLALERLKLEHGPIVFVIDAIDEVGQDGVTLGFLPERLPTGVSGLLTARHNSGAVSWLTSNLDIERIKLRNLEKNEIALITGIDSSKGEAESKFNNRVWQDSKGWPMLVTAAAKEARLRNGDLAAVQTYDQPYTVFWRQAKEWRTDNLLGTKDLLKEILILLALFEPVAPIKLDLLQSYVLYQHCELSLADIQQLLQPVSGQIEGLDEGQIKLGLKAFAEFIRDKYCSLKDLRHALEAIVLWLSIDEEIDGKTVAAFLHYWTDPIQVSPVNLRVIANDLIADLENRSASNLLYDVYLVSQDKLGHKKNLLPYAHSCLQAAANLHEPRALRELGSRFIDGVGVRHDPEEGERLLRMASELGDARSMISLALRLLNGHGIDMNCAQGEEWLRRAVAMGSEDAKGLLADRLIDGSGIPQNVLEGECLLKELADAGSKRARLDLAVRQLSGDGLPEYIPGAEALLRELAAENDSAGTLVLAIQLLQGSSINKDVKEGERLIRGLAEKRDIGAMTLLGNLLIDGFGLVKQPEEGEQWLRRAVENNDPGAMFALGRRLLKGDGLMQAITQGEDLLQQAIELGNSSAAIVLSNLLLEGKHLPKDIKRSDSILEEAAIAGDVRAMLNMGVRLLHGKDTPHKPQQAEQWLRRSANSGNKSAMSVLGSALLNDTQLPKNELEGLEWLKKSADAGDKDAGITLANRFLDAWGVARDEVKGKQWLLSLAEKGYTEAMIDLGSRLIDGKGLAKNAEEGMHWLLYAACAGDYPVMSLIGERLLDGNGVKRDAVVGERWLRTAIKLEEPQAMAILGSRIIEYRCYASDLGEGERLLRMASEAGDSSATRVLGNLLIMGRHLKKNAAEGEHFLRKAIAEDDAMAMTDMSDYLLGGVDLKSDLKEGEALLRRAAERGYPKAMSKLGKYLIKDSWSASRVRDGEKWLKLAAQYDNAFSNEPMVQDLSLLKDSPQRLYDLEVVLRQSAEAGNSSAMLNLSVFLLEKAPDVSAVTESELWLRRAAEAGNPNAMLSLYYALESGEWIKKDLVEAEALLIKAMDAGINGAYQIKGRLEYDQRHLDEAATFFATAFYAGSSAAAVNLAYMLRRGEVDQKQDLPVIPHLLAASIGERDLFGLINYALYLAADVQCEQNWSVADEVFASLSNADQPALNALSWWFEEPSMKDDPESHLVLGWLTRHHLVDDPEALSVADRMAKARAGGWDVPIWMDIPV